jgi:hypothetical protein
MRTKLLSIGCVLALLLLAAGALQASINPVPNGSGARAYFGSQGTAYMDSDPITTFTAAAPIGPYPAGVGTPLPNLPAPPVSPMFPATSGYNFNGGTGYNFNFVDSLGGTTGYTAADTTIDHLYNPSGTLASDASINFPVWRFSQGPTAPSYAYEQINFVSQYQVTNTLNASTPSIPLFISGTLSPLGTPFGQFDAAITYSWLPTNSAFIVNGPTQNLGTLYYSWLTSTPGTFFTPIVSTGSLVGTSTNFGILELTGYAYVTGDPFDITISSTPEPATLSLLALGGLALLRRRRSR